MSGKLEEESRAFFRHPERLTYKALTPREGGGGQFAQLYQRYNIKAQNCAIRELLYACTNWTIIYDDNVGWIVRAEPK